MSGKEHRLAAIQRIIPSGSNNPHAAIPPRHRAVCSCGWRSNGVYRTPKDARQAWETGHTLPTGDTRNTKHAPRITDVHN